MHRHTASSMRGQRRPVPAEEATSGLENVLRMKNICAELPNPQRDTCAAGYSTTRSAFAPFSPRLVFNSQDATTHPAPPLSKRLGCPLPFSRIPTQLVPCLPVPRPHLRAAAPHEVLVEHGPFRGVWGPRAAQGAQGAQGGQVAVHPGLKVGAAVVLGRGRQREERAM